MERAGRIIGKLKIPKEVIDSETLARSAWPVAVGKRIAIRTRVIRLVRSTLVVECEDAIWQRQLNTLSGQILRNIATLAGDGVVTSIDLRPMTPRRAMQTAITADGVPAQRSLLLMEDEADRIQDPVFRMLYKQSRKKAAAGEKLQQQGLFEDIRKKASA